MKTSMEKIKATAVVIGMAVLYATPVMAQTTGSGTTGSTGASGTSGATTMTRTTDATEDRDWGWLGLIGLAGLAGLMRRERHQDVGQPRTATPR